MRDPIILGPYRVPLISGNSHLRSSGIENRRCESCDVCMLKCERAFWPCDASAAAATTLAELVSPKEE